jgi:hypothetical protein
MEILDLLGGWANLVVHVPSLFVRQNLGRHRRAPPEPTTPAMFLWARMPARLQAY